MGVVDQTVEDGVGQGGVTDGGVPVVNRKLTCHDGRAVSMAVIKHLQQVAPIDVIE